jgi:hypothetical protein
MTERAPELTRAEKLAVERPWRAFVVAPLLTAVLTFGIGLEKIAVYPIGSALRSAALWAAFTSAIVLVSMGFKRDSGLRKMEDRDSGSTL